MSSSFQKRIAVSLLLTPDLDSTQVCLVERDRHLKFFGGYWAFPGGVLDREDAGVEVQNPPQLSQADADNDLNAFIAAAAREVLEETGIWMGRGGPEPSQERLDSYRGQLLENRIALGQILEWEGQHLDGRDFEPICRITTPPPAPVRYDTWFLRCLIPPQARIDVWPGELVQGKIWEASQALDAWRRGELWLAPPVFALLSELKDRSCRTLIPFASQLTRSYARGKLHRVYFSPGILIAPLQTQTQPPAAHTNSYLVGEEDLYLLDPGSTDPSEQARLWELLDELTSEGRELKGILLTHSHSDHVGAVRECQRRYRTPLFGHALTAKALPDLSFDGTLSDGDGLDLGTAPDGSPDWRLSVHHLPGHAPDHLVFQESRYRAVLAGDLISTLSSILIDPSQGDLQTYLHSLEELQRLTTSMLYPGHGPPAKDGPRVVDEAIQHRRKRERQLLEALTDRPRSLRHLLSIVYSDVPGLLRPLAQRSLLSGLIHLEKQGKCEKTWRGYRRTP